MNATTCISSEKHLEEPPNVENTPISITLSIASAISGVVFSGQWHVMMLYTPRFYVKQ
jgi:hypothetical protein